MTSCVEDHMHKSLARHEITEIHQSQRTWPVTEVMNVVPDQIIHAYRMRQPDSGYYSALIIFSPIGITIGGDIRILSQSSISSCAGYNEEWFGGHLDEDYLCGKFNLDWTRHPKKSMVGQRTHASCGWLCALQQRFNTLYQAFKE